MQALVEYLLKLVSYVYSTMFLDWGGQVGTFEFQAAFVFILNYYLEWAFSSFFL